MATTTRTCAWCEASGESMSKCSQCKVTYYCDAECQTNHWKTHKRECRRRTSNKSNDGSSSSSSSSSNNSASNRSSRATSSAPGTPTANFSYPTFRDRQQGDIRLDVAAINSLGPNHGDRNPIQNTFEPFHIPELDETQRRDWLHRGNVDPPASWMKLWRFPTDRGTPGAVECQPCQCPTGLCKAAQRGGQAVTRRSAGVIVHDCVSCWSCKAAFSAPCVPGFDQMPGQPSYSPAKSPDSLMCGWGKCPLCGAKLGVQSLPTTFAPILISLLGAVDNIGFDGDTAAQTAAIGRALSVEIDFCSHMAHLIKHRFTGKDEGARYCTRSINACNKLRSVSPALFDAGVADHFYYAHLLRAKFEGNKSLRKAILRAVPNFKSSGEGEGSSGFQLRPIVFHKPPAGAPKGSFTPCSPFTNMTPSPAPTSRPGLPDGVFDAMFLDRGDFEAAGLHWLRERKVFYSLRGEPAAVAAGTPQAVRPMRFPDSDEQYLMLDHDRRGLVQAKMPSTSFKWLIDVSKPGGGKSSPLTGAVLTYIHYDYRWVFKTKSAAKSYWDVLRVLRSEERTVTSNDPAMALLQGCRPVSELGFESSADMRAAADECVVLRTGEDAGLGVLFRGSGVPGHSDTYNVLLRVGRVCAKLYLQIIQFCEVTGGGGGGGGGGGSGNRGHGGKKYQELRDLRRLDWEAEVPTAVVELATRAAQKIRASLRAASAEAASAPPSATPRRVNRVAETVTVGSVEDFQAIPEILNIIGRRVELHSLRGRPELNGRTAVLTNYTPASRRFTAALEEGGGAEGEGEQSEQQIRVLRANFRVLDELGVG